MSDEVLLIHNMDYLSSDEGMRAFNKCSVVLLKDSTGMYNTVIKNSYGDSGIINNKDDGKTWQNVWHLW